MRSAPRRSFSSLSGASFFLLAALSGVGAKCCADQHEDCSALECYPWLTCESYTDAEALPVETCEIRCARNEDCPIDQLCTDVTPGPGWICMECTTAGEQTDDPETCCAGLTAMSSCLPGQAACDESFYCTACGDGACGEHESPWECPADCSDCSALGLDAATCAKSTVDFWVEEKQRETAAELEAMSFADRAEAIADKAWYGESPGASIAEIYSDGRLHRLSRVPLSAEDLGLGRDATAVEMANGFVDRFRTLLLGLGRESALTRFTREVELTGETVTIYRQSIGGVFVVGGAVTVAVDSHKRILYVSNTTLPHISYGTTPDVELADAVASIGRVLDREVVSTRHGLYIYPELDEQSSSRLAYEIAVADIRSGEPLGAFRVDAFTGEVLIIHDLEWSFPIEGVVFPQPNQEPKVQFYDAEEPYERAYCVDYNESTDSCDEWFYGGNGLDSNYSPSDNGVDFDQDLIWENGVWESASPLKMVEFGPDAMFIWDLLRSDYSTNPSGILGTMESPFRLFLGVRMEGETVAYAASSNFGEYEGLHLVEGSESVGTTAHEFGHRVDQVNILVKPSDELREGLGDAFNMIYVQKYYSDPDAQEELCRNVDGEQVSDVLDPGIDHSCFSTWQEEPSPGWYHQNIQVTPIGKYTRCSAVESLSLDDDEADLTENIWRSFRDPMAKNHGHGRGPRTFDQLGNAAGKVFVRGVLFENAINAGDDEYFDQYCSSNSSSAICECGSNFGVGHGNLGVHNRFFYDLTSYGDAEYSLASGDPAEAAETQKSLVDAIYSVELDGYTEWEERVSGVLEGSLTSTTLSDSQKQRIKKSLRDTKVFGEIGSVSNGYSDLEAVTFWSDADDQRLFVFHRQSDATDEVVLPKEIGYSVYDLSGALGNTTLVAECALPDVTVSGQDDPAPAVSGFAPTAVNLGDRLWVAWAQYDAAQPAQGFGHLAYATLQPSLTDPSGCGTWSEVVYDAGTEVYGSLRSTLIDRGFVYNDSTQWVDCPNPPCIELPFDEWKTRVNPPDYRTLVMLENLGFELDNVQSDAILGQADVRGLDVDEQESLENAIAAMQSLVATDGLGVSRQPTARDGRAPKEADKSLDLNMLELNVGLEKADARAPEITAAIAELMPNTVSFLRGLKSSSAPVGVRMRVWEYPAPDELQLEPGTTFDISLLTVSTVAVSFLGAEQDDGTRRAMVREFGATEDPFEPVDHVIGRASYTPGLATVGQTEEEENSIMSIARDNVVACTDFVYDSLSEDEIGRMMCRVFLGADFTPTVGGIRKLKPAEEVDSAQIGTDLVEVGVQLNIAASPRLLTTGGGTGDAVFVLYRLNGGESDPMRYLAFRGVEAAPITLNPVMSGLSFPDSFDGPSRLFIDRDLEVTVSSLPSFSGTERWPVFPGAFWVTEYETLGYVGVDALSGYATRFFARGPSMAE